MQLQDVLALLRAMPADERASISHDILEGTKNLAWVANPGQQRLAAQSQADELFYGGAAGGGKSDLMIGLSLTEHQKSLILRRTNKEAKKLVERYKEILNHSEGWNSHDSVWRIDGRVIDMGGCEHEDDKQKFKGSPHDLIGFDEVSDFTETQYTFITAWNRAVNADQHCRVIAAGNPPTRPEGFWVLRYWGPWLDTTHPNPAKPGELRWFLGGTEVDGPGPHLLDGKLVRARSRTFIPAKLDDNVELAATGYDSVLANLPEELRQAYRDGKFDAALKDAPYQAIPTAWIRLAQARWAAEPPRGIPMTGMSVDASGGGADPMILSVRHDGWFAPLVEVEGKSIPMDNIGPYCAGIVVQHRRNEAPVIVDMGGGYGGSLHDHLRANGVDVRRYKGAESSARRSRDGRYPFVNTRSAAIWTFREALDPGQEGGSPIALPQDPALVADLTSPTFEVGPNGIKVEAKEAVCKRLSRSTDRGDAVVMNWFLGGRIASHFEEFTPEQASANGPGRYRTNATPAVNFGPRRQHGVRR